MGRTAICITATRFNRISQVWAARFRGLAPTATAVPALRASEPVVPRGFGREAARLLVVGLG